VTGGDGLFGIFAHEAALVEKNPEKSSPPVTRHPAGEEPPGREDRVRCALSPPDVSDNAQLARQRSEAAAQREASQDAAVAQAFEVLERAADEVSRRGLVAFAERAGRMYARALARLRREDRRAIRELLRASR